MRRILINHAEARGALKRGGGRQRVPLDAAEPAAAQPNDLLALDRALQTLAEHDERKANVVEMRYFGGMTVEMVAQVLDVSRSTVEADWRLARAWLSNELDGGTDG
mgnify:CR=1 FL=1